MPGPNGRRLLRWVLTLGPLVEVAAQDDVMGLHPYAGVFAIAAQIEPRNQLMVLRFQQT